MPDTCDASEVGQSSASTSEQTPPVIDAADVDLDAFRALLDEDFAAYERRRDALTAALSPRGQFVRRLQAADTGSAYHRKLRCLRPTKPLEKLVRADSFDRELLNLELRKGRACKHKLCTRDRCGLHILDAVVTREEAAALAAHGEAVLAAEGAAAHDFGKPYRRVDMVSACLHVPFAPSRVSYISIVSKAVEV